MYNRREISLAAVQSVPFNIISRDQYIAEVVIAKMDGEITLHFGDTADGIDINSPISFQPTGDEASHGLYFTNKSAQAGKVAVLIIVTGKRPALNTELQRV